jgi:carbamoyltransferase
MVYVLGINQGHNACAALLHDGSIVACIQEERITRVKNQSGMPSNAIRWLLATAAVSPADIDLVAYSLNEGPPEAGLHEPYRVPGGLLENAYVALRNRPNSLEYRLPAASRARLTLFSMFFNACNLVFSSRRKSHISASIGKDGAAVRSVEHHLCHAAAPSYGAYHGDGLVLTLDGEGDHLCSTVSTLAGRNLRRIALTHRDHSLGYVYLSATRHLGLKPLEDEHKVMGLAPYADPAKGARVRSRLAGLVTLDAKNPMQFTSRLRTDFAGRVMEDRLSGARFDQLAWGVQSLTEKVVTKWVSRAIEGTGSGRLYLSGGLFMNVKLNLRISQLPEVEEVYPFPSCGDESNAVGGAFAGYAAICCSYGARFTPQALENMYLGPEFSEDEIASAISSSKGAGAFRVDKYSDIDGTVGEMLAKGHIVARFAGRMEWGARALGNRSILANASEPGVARELNFAIKQRDFWMPFAPTVLAERQGDYLVNEKGIPSPFMNMAFDTEPLAQKDLAAALHSYDHTCRPQVLLPESNPGYHHLVRVFEGLTGIGGVLNTSFNLHGEPVVCTPLDAVSTFLRSGLSRLALGPFLLTKG